MKKSKLIKKMVHWSLAVLVVVYIITGYGITKYRIVESLTGGLLSKNLSFKIHNNLEVPFIILLALHMYFTLSKRRKKDETRVEN